MADFTPSANLSGKILAKVNSNLIFELRLSGQFVGKNGHFGSIRIDVFLDNQVTSGAQCRKILIRLIAY